ncbi:hypothetical protein PIROE2DRAFT_59496 [Piromyces sp. E2]|nr:hypothetical protein PIROE2DRAFT_59496 [Piromyces sp. E2]|eukprot:OUM66231.1 hypothetical protein PIROE2DRAFT_59496 [Piromyces sp. E2]
MYIENTIFKRNESKSGGAIYVSLNNDGKNNFHKMTLNNCVFENNKASYFGGAIFTENVVKFKADLINSSFKYNKAGIAGGAVFTTGLSRDISIVNTTKENNTGGYYGDNNASYPLLIYLENNNKYSKGISITSGSTLSLLFELRDIFNQTINRNEEYFSSLQLKAELIDDDDNNSGEIINNDNQSQTYILKNNDGYFFNGYCLLNDLQIISNPKHYKLHFHIENDIYNLKFLTNDIPIEVTNCNEKQIIKLYKNNINYCEKPICKEKYINGECLPIQNSSYIYQESYCKCFDGFNNTSCNSKIYEISS